MPCAEISCLLFLFTYDVSLSPRSIRRLWFEIVLRTGDTNSKKLSKEECQNLAPHMLHPNAIPKECRKYADVMQYLKRHDTDTAHPTQWMS